MVAGAAPLSPARREHPATGLSSAGRPIRRICGLRPIIERKLFGRMLAEARQTSIRRRHAGSVRRTPPNPIDLDPFSQAIMSGRPHPIRAARGCTAASGCCGGPAPAAVDACCADDADAKAVGKTGCGCS
jgi:hypothetical protein